MHARPTAQIIDGRALAKDKRDSIAARASALRAAGRPARLDAVLVDGGDNAARVYAENQASTCEEVGIDYQLHVLDAGCGRGEIEAKLRALNADPGVHAVMMHMPLPEGIDGYPLKRLIDPDKDVEGVNPANIGNIVYGRSSLAPCTALATLELIDHTGIDLRGKRVVVVGQSTTVGRPIAVLLMRRDATVISCNVHSWGVPELCASADVIVTAAGVPGLIKPDMVREGAVVIDVGVNRIEDEDGNRRTVGDVEFDGVAEKTSWISPVPGGVGPMTVAMLLSNVVEAAELATDSPRGDSPA